MVAGRVAADDEHAVGVLQIFEFDRRCAAAGDARQSDAAGLVTIEAAVVDVIRAVEAGEKLQQEPGLVAAAAAEVPKRFIGRRGAKFGRDAFECFFPGDRRIAAGFARVANGLDQSAAVLRVCAAKVVADRAPNTCSQKSLRMAPCMSATIACRLFLQTSGKWPSSLTMPPRWPPMPSAQVLQAFFERIARRA